MNAPIQRPWRTGRRLLAGLVLLLALPLAAGQASLNVYFQSTLKDAGYQKKVFQKVAAAWKAPATGKSSDSVCPAR